MTSDLVKRLQEQYAGVASVVPEVGQLLDRIEALEREQEWRPIESAPHDRTWVLLHGDGPGFAQCPFVGYYDEETPGDGPHWWRATHGTSARWAYCEPTHWMPLPQLTEAK